MTPLNRRELLKLGALSFAALPVARTWATPYRKHHCIVVGAGLAGLTAALRLKQKGWTVTILEARDRTGGRVWSHRFDESPELVCEMGGEWIGNEHHRILALCKELNVPLEPHAFKPWLLQDGKLKSPGQWSYSSQAKKGWAKFAAEYARYTPAQQRNLDRYDWWTWLRKIGYSPQDLRTRELFDSTDSGESMHTESAFAAASSYVGADETDEMDSHVLNGNSELIRTLTAHLDPGSIHLNSVVTRIEQRNGTVTVTCSSGTYKADACIYSAPASTLNTVAFDPPLSAAKKEAAEHLEYARIIKTQVLFNERFWPVEDFSLMSDATPQQYFNTTLGQSGKRGILCSYAIGDKADVLAAQDDQRRLDMVTRDLLPAFPRAASLAVASYAHAWQDDPFVGGAYAIYRPGQWFTIRPTLAAPHGKIFFAGEHLADWQGFMEGAVDTGEIAARHLLAAGA